MSPSFDAIGRPGLCSTICRDLNEPLAGTAAVASGWLVLEQPGPWGRKAPIQSHLDPEFGAKIDAAAKKADVRFGLIRSPGKHADHPPRSHQVYVACTLPGRTWLLGGSVADPLTLAALDLDAVAHGDRDAVMASLPDLSPVTEPVLLVCTNGKRDECCALLGRPIAAGLADRVPGRVWESSHLGGHRFAPTATLLPAGIMYGRLDVETAAAILAAAERGDTVLSKQRGRSSWTGRGQVAEIAVRNLTGEVALDALSVLAENLDTVTVGHLDGRVWTVEVTSETADPPRPESCGKESFDMTILRAGTVNPGAPR
ncbi:sucrase ferredoxin [Kribbella sancticallisti]|uniref:Sucrase ferredoxin n=1 Tax=Kribbella sancticallisti TaxID=460087 RepID=A0ABP4NXG0_9ACTN